MTAHPAEVIGGCCASTPGGDAEASFLDDETLVARSRCGDLTAFPELLRRHKEKLLRLAMQLVGNIDDAQEILQSASLSAWQNLPAFEGRSQVGTWFHRVVVNASLTWLRTNRRYAKDASLGLASAPLHLLAQQACHASGMDWAQKPDEHAQRRELCTQLQQAMDRLPASLQRVFLVSAVEGLSIAETAQLLGLSEPATKTRLHRARRALRRDMLVYLSP